MLKTFYLLCYSLPFHYPYSILDFQVVTPTNNVLVEDLTLRVEVGSNLLITGTLFRLRLVISLHDYSINWLPFLMSYRVGLCLFRRKEQYVYDCE